MNKKIITNISSVLLSTSIVACGTEQKSAEKINSPQTKDEFLWLEDINSKQSLAWVNEQNKLSVDLLTADSRYQTTENEIKKILSNKERIPYPHTLGKYIYNFWTDENNPRGLWRRCSHSEYKKKNPNWEIVLDIDALGKSENTSWVYKHVSILKPENRYALVFLSRGGKDATEIREFDLEKKSFVKDGFFIPEAKTNVTWIDHDHLMLGTDFGPGSLTDSGYSRIIKLWTRGTKISEAKTIYEAQTKDMAARVYSIFRDQKPYVFINRRIDFYTAETFFVKNDNLIKLPIPETSEFNELLNDRIYFLLKKDWTFPNDKSRSERNYKAGSLLSFNLNDFLNSSKIVPRLEYKPTKKQSLSSVKASKTKLWLEIVDNVKPTVYELKDKGSLKRVELPEIGTASAIDVNTETDDIFLSYSSFLTPPALYFFQKNNLTLSKTTPKMYNEKNLVVKQYFAISKDGTKIPYFIVYNKNIKYNSRNPTLLYSYGGFENSLNPFYLNSIGKTWSEHGGIYVQANIRGGGEFGPKWHQAALRENRQRAFDDFYSVAEDLFRRKITSPEKLAIKGGSNGGLLMGAAFTQKPDLFKAVICAVPLLDMLRFHKLLAGASWVAEYGNPDVASDRSFIEKYSPYQNLNPNQKYPKVFFITSTKDDRVHPGHARKMAALFNKYKHPYLYYENTEGGHGGAADLQQRAKFEALQYVYLYKEILDSK